MTTRPDPAGDLQAVARAMPEASQPQATFAALDAALAHAIGHRLFTVLVVNLAASENQRVYTNRPEAYPVGGAKPIRWENPLTQAVVGAGRCWLTHTASEVRDTFPDHALIHSLGCESSINVPVRWNGQTIAMLNLLNQAGWYSEADVPTLSVFAGLATPAVLGIIAAWPTAADRIR